MDNYYNKYLKYKLKYINLKKQIGGNCDRHYHEEFIYYRGTIISLVLPFHVKGHAYKHMDTILGRCYAPGEGGHSIINQYIEHIINRPFFTTPLGTLDKEKIIKLICQLSDTLWMYIMVQCVQDALSKKFIVFQIYKCDENGKGINTDNSFYSGSSTWGPIVDNTFTTDKYTFIIPPLFSGLSSVPFGTVSGSASSSSKPTLDPHGGIDTSAIRFIYPASSYTQLIQNVVAAPVSAFAPAPAPAPSSKPFWL
jgi:hypothetical protein